MKAWCVILGSTRWLSLCSACSLLCSPSTTAASIEPLSLTSRLLQSPWSSAVVTASLMCSYTLERGQVSYRHQASTHTFYARNSASGNSQIKHKLSHHLILITTFCIIHVCQTFYYNSSNDSLQSRGHQFFYLAKGQSGRRGLNSGHFLDKLPLWMTIMSEGLIHIWDSRLLWGSHWWRVKIRIQRPDAHSLWKCGLICPILPLYVGFCFF